MAVLGLWTDPVKVIPLLDTWRDILSAQHVGQLGPQQQHEQNGFRKDRSCVEYIVVLTSIVINRLNSKLITFAVSIDFRKAFDCIDRNILFFKLLQYNIDGKILLSPFIIFMSSLSRTLN